MASHICLRASFKISVSPWSCINNFVDKKNCNGILNYLELEQKLRRMVLLAKT